LISTPVHYYNCMYVFCSDFWFSSHNKSDDYYLAQWTNAAGYVPLQIVAGFNAMMEFNISVAEMIAVSTHSIICLVQLIILKRQSRPNLYINLRIPRQKGETPGPERTVRRREWYGGLSTPQADGTRDAQREQRMCLQAMPSKPLVDGWAEDPRPHTACHVGRHTSPQKQRKRGSCSSTGH
jgi:hypothetical protein